MHVFCLFIYIFCQGLINKYWRDFFYFLDYKVHKRAAEHNCIRPERTNLVFDVIPEPEPIRIFDGIMEEYPVYSEDAGEIDPEDFNPKLRIEGWAYDEYAMFYSHKGYILMVCYFVGFFIYMLLRIQDSLGFYACLHFWIFELFSLYILCSFAFIYFMIFKVTLIQTGIFIYFWPRIYIYYFYATEPYKNYKEWERINWYWLHRFMLILCCITSIIVAPFIIYFCIHFLIFCNPFPILSR